MDQQRVLIWQDAFYQNCSTTLILEGAGVEYDKACHCVSEYVSQNYGSSSPEEDYDEKQSA